MTPADDLGAGRADASAGAPAADDDTATWRALGSPLVTPTGFGPLDGETVAVKDLYAIRGYSIGAGIPEYAATHMPETENSPVIDALLGAGAAIAGIAQTDQLAYSIGGKNLRYGVPPNAAFPDRLPGGSSSGSASAVARGLAGIGLGTDTAGSIRVPAAYQGLWGLRTTHGVISRRRLLPLAPSFDAVGLLTRDAALLEAAAGVVLAGAPSLSGRFAATGAADGGFVCAPGLVALASGDAAAVPGAIAAAADAASETPPVDVDAVFAAFRVVQAFEAWAAHGDWLTAHPGVLDADVAARFADAAAVTETAADAARSDAASARSAIRDWLGDRVLILPTTAGRAPLLSATAAEVDAERGRTLRLTALASIAGLPAVAAPVRGADGLPSSVCFVGPAGSDLALIRAAARAVA